MRNMQPAARWRPVGTVLVDNGSITPAQLDAALAEQRRSGRKIGEILISTGAITWLTLAHAIAEQAQEMNEVAPPVLQEVPPPPPLSAGIDVKDVATRAIKNRAIEEAQKALKKGLGGFFK